MPRHDRFEPRRLLLCELLEVLEQPLLQHLTHAVAGGDAVMFRLEVQRDRRARLGAVARGDLDIGAGARLPAHALSGVEATALDDDALGEHEGAEQADAELADQAVAVAGALWRQRER